MNVRELIDVLGAGDLGAEVWVGVPTPKGGAIWRPLECIEDRVEAGPGARAPYGQGAGPGRLLLVGLARSAEDAAPEPLRDVAGLAEGLAQGMGG